MRINPKYSNVCGLRIGMYRSEQCTAGKVCQFLSECDLYYNEETNEFDYPVQWHTDKGKGRLTSGRHKPTNKERGNNRRMK
jgi:hypothetical protein